MVGALPSSGFLTQHASVLLFLVVGIAIASMLYVAVADLIPGLHRRPELHATVQQVVMIALGVGTIWLVGDLAHAHAGPR